MSRTLTLELAEKVGNLDPMKTVVIIQLLDNRIYECRLENGDRFPPQKRKDGKCNAPGVPSIINKESLREHFRPIQPIFRSVKCFKALVLSPLPCYPWARCCTDPNHILNSESPSCVTDMGRALRDITTSLRNIIFMRKFKEVSIVNSVEALGIFPGSSGEVVDKARSSTWGRDPVHPLPAAYKLKAGKLAKRAASVLAEKLSASSAMAGGTKRKVDQRDSWVTGSFAIAKCAEPPGGPPPPRGTVGSGHPHYAHPGCAKLQLSVEGRARSTGWRVAVRSLPGILQ